MTKRHSKVIVQNGVCACQTVQITQVHHRDFPEIWTQGGSAHEGATQLARSFERALEASRSTWHRDAMAGALDDVRQFLADSQRSSPPERTQAGQEACTTIA